MIQPLEAKYSYISVDPTLDNLDQVQDLFLAERPTLRKFNDLNWRKVHSMWREEIAELNGHKDEGYDSLIDFRHQEIADIVIYTLSLFNSIKRDPDDERAFERAEQLAQEYCIRPVSADVRIFLTDEFDEHQEETYELLRARLNQAADRYHNGLSIDEQVGVLHEVLAISFVMYYLMGLHPIRSVMEKTIRNMLKYPVAIMGQDLEETPGLSQEEQIAVWEPIYRERSNRSKDQFDGPIDPVTGKRPMTGTREFYNGFRELKKGQKESIVDTAMIPVAVGLLETA